MLCNFAPEKKECINWGRVALCLIPFVGQAEEGDDQSGC